MTNMYGHHGVRREQVGILLCVYSSSVKMDPK